MEKIDIKFNNPALLKLALTHRSACVDGELYSNERLEFLGDAVLEFVISEALYEKFPKEAEGFMTKLRSALVRQNSLAEAARKLDLGKLLILGRGEAASGGAEKEYLLANTFEALIGAIYLDQGISAVKRLTTKLILPNIESIIAKKAYIDDKTLLQEYVQAEMKTTPKYKAISSKGPDHERVFTVVSIISDKKYMIGEGRTKQLAEEDAARKTLDHLKSFGFSS